MMNTEQYREHVERTFNAFCKIVLYHAALGIYKKIRKKQQFEVSLDYLREFDFEPVTTTDEYFVKYDMPTIFPVFAVEQPRGRKRINRFRPQYMMICYAIGSENALHNAALQT